MVDFTILPHALFVPIQMYKGIGNWTTPMDSEANCSSIYWRITLKVSHCVPTYLKGRARLSGTMKVQWLGSFIWNEKNKNYYCLFLAILIFPRCILFKPKTDFEIYDILCKVFLRLLEQQGLKKHNLQKKMFFEPKRFGIRPRCFLMLN